MRKINVNFEVTSFLINKSAKNFIKTISKNIHFLNNTNNNPSKLNQFSFQFKNKISLCKIQIRNFSEKESHKLDPYLILEVNRGADFKTIKAAYFKLARLYHPDTNKNDERAQKKFLLIKEAYEYFDKKYNPQKYANLRMTISKFDDAENEKQSSTAEGSANEAEKEYQSIRNKHRKKYSESGKDGEKGEKYSFNFSFDERTNYHGTFEESNEIFMEKKFKLDQFKKENIEKFLFTKAPVPRSYRMIDRLDLKSVTLGKGKIFGADDYLGITLLTIFIAMLFMSRKKEYKTYTFENLENVNIYNALKPSEINKIYESNEISPIEQVIMNTKEHTQYRQKKLAEQMATKNTLNVSLGVINDVPKTDLRKRFNEQINKNKGTEI